MAAEQGIPHAQCNLGCVYGSYGASHGVSPDIKEAVRWFEKAAEQGYANAQANLGTAYATGDGVKQNLEAAKYWLRKAAAQGHATAQLSLDMGELAFGDLGRRNH